MVEKRKKYLSSLLAVFMALTIFTMTAYAKSDEKQTDAEEKEYVYDEADLISILDEEELNERCQEASEEFKMDIVIATTYNTDGRTARTYAEDLIVENDLGYENDDRAEKSCILFLIDLDNNETYIATSGFSILCVEDEDIEDILDQIYVYIRNDYYMSCLAFIDKTEYVLDKNLDDYADEYVEKWENYEGGYEEFYNKYVDVEHNIFYKLRNPVVCLAISVIIAGVTVVIMAYRNKAKMTANGNTYMDRNEFKIRLENDRYINTTTVRRKIETNSGGSGGGSRGGSFHRGSGGRSFGGGGRKL